MIIFRFSRTLLRLFPFMLVSLVVTLPTPAVSEEHSPTERCSFTHEEEMFGNEVLEIRRLLLDERITCKEYQDIFETHKQWEHERNRERDRGRYSNIGTDSEDIQQRLVDERHFNGKDLRNLDMAWADLTGVHLNGANISGSGIRAERTPGIGRGYRHRIDLTQARLTGAQVGRATAKETLLRFAFLVGVDFEETDLSGAVLYGSDLRWASFINSVLTDADLSDADLQGVIFEPKSGTLPNIGKISLARNLEKMTYHESPLQLSELRRAFDLADLTDQAKRLTYAIQRTKRIKGLHQGPFRQLLSVVYLVAFEWTSDYGLKPFRPFVVAFLLIPAFGTVYFIALVKGGTNRLWISRENGPTKRSSSYQWFALGKVIRGRPYRRRWTYVKVAMWFSLMCAFRVGFREIDIGQWLARLQPYPYRIEARGWCRSIAGLQSLISVYLLALSFLSIVGRPFG